ncbi:MAG TPA: DUF4173 domain-containing protein [Thermoanaerobaculia bacterium]
MRDFNVEVLDLSVVTSGSASQWTIAALCSTKFTMYDHRAAVNVALTGLGIGLAASVLLRHIPWGLNVALWTLLFVAAAVTLTQRFRPQPLVRLLLPGLCALLAAIGIVWRDAAPLVWLDVVVGHFMLLLVALPAREVRATAAGLMELAAAIVTTAGQTIGALFQLPFSDLQWRRLASGDGSSRLMTLIRGGLLAFPLLLIFGVLLGSADAAFAELLRDLIFVDIIDLFAHVFVTLVVGVIAACFFRSLIASGPMPRREKPRVLTLRAAELNVALTLVNVMFAAFVAVQFRYLFGGTTVIRVTESLTYAEYARRGFFELAIVVALVIPLLLFAEWIVNKEDAKALRFFRILTYAMVALVLVIAASAYRRMELYRDEYGLTELRVYTTAFIVWLAALLVWLAVTALSGRRERFAIGAIATGFVALMTLHAINPDALIVRTNRARASAGVRPFDVGYHGRLSADARLALLERGTPLPPCAAKLLLRTQPTTPPRWRTWNVARSKAWHRVEERRWELTRDAAACARPRELRPAGVRP